MTRPPCPSCGRPTVRPSRRLGERVSERGGTGRWAVLVAFGRADIWGPHGQYIETHERHEDAMDAVQVYALADHLAHRDAA
ncbi:hypothetical protein EDD28_2445 [Salana multivorans]|uniref:Uncharacterized protein n=1 Tax=Salana multivorans TaxID=120377 RepID=A0A3N2DDI6_9MICO|nr:hypothetical protein EDD28_3457 [Salana multivorans]ROR97836.1 hypothetical protein EDD28_2445 [Salana multivorans]